MSTKDIKINKLINYINNYFDEYPFDKAIDMVYFSVLIDEFPYINILDELKKFHLWVMELPDHNKCNYFRKSFKTWLKNNNNYNCEV